MRKKQETGTKQIVKPVKKTARLLQIRANMRRDLKRYGSPGRYPGPGKKMEGSSPQARKDGGKFSMTSYRRLNLREARKKRKGGGGVSYV